MAIDDALRFLAEVSSCAAGLVPRVAGNPRNANLAKNVAGVFEAYKSRRIALCIPPDMRGLSNTERDLVSRIRTCAKTALSIL